MSKGTLLVSPHADDTVMQAFGMLRKNVLPGPLYLVTVFARSNYMVIERRIFMQGRTIPKLLPRPNELISALRKNRGHFGGSRVKLLARLLDLEEIYKVSRIRLSEDIAFAKSIGAKIKYFDLPDCKVRYGEAIMDPDWPLLPDEPLSTTLTSLLERVIKETGVANVVSPWPYGGRQHLDHRLVFRAANQVAHELNKGLYYVDDQPYSRRPLDVARDDFGRVCSPVLVKLSILDMKGKYEAMNIYGSQMIDQYFAAVRSALPGSSTEGYSETLWTTLP
ncbi:MAG: PIG-L family deacetylase [Thaumarchaeota archaeon]|nr:PIG-L family deacetylase [Nitrososphaerota archaeon]